jgi:hypothetical protein
MGHQRAHLDKEVLFAGRQILSRGDAGPKFLHRLSLLLRTFCADCAPL